MKASRQELVGNGKRERNILTLSDNLKMEPPGVYSKGVRKESIDME